MSFVSPEFAVLALFFFPIYWSLHTKPTWQQRLLWISGYALYATWSPYFALILAFYSFGLWLLGQQLQGTKARLWLSLGLIVTVGFLVLVKYYEYLTSQFILVMQLIGFSPPMPLVDWVAPAGVSFFTFQAITYLVAINQQKLPPQPLERVLLFMCFWPTLFAGPIFRAEQFFLQLESTPSQSTQTGRPIQSSLAIYWILLGLVQKLVLASWLANTFVDPVFKYPDMHEGLSVLSAMVAYTLQIFFDFAGYTLIVTGLGLLLGYQLPENFRQPYLASDLATFWQRWHISLSSFIRDYIYIPLGGNRFGFVRTQINLLIAMLLSGLWHGAGTNFVLWGLLHAFGMIWLNWRRALQKPRWPVPLARLVTLVFLAITWVFFRSGSAGGTTADAWHIFSTLFHFNAAAWQIPKTEMMPLFGLIFLCACLAYLSPRAVQIQNRVTQSLEGLHFVVWVALIVGVFSLCLTFAPSGIPNFIYYQF